MQVLYDAAAGGAPLALLGALHPAPITDLAWSRDGRFLAAASYDGYCRRGPRLSTTLNPGRRVLRRLLQARAPPEHHPHPWPPRPATAAAGARPA